MMFDSAYLEIEILGKERERFFNLCAFHHITLYHIRYKEEALLVKIKASDLFLMKRIVKKTEIKLKIIEKKGLYFTLKAMKYQKIFFLCLLSGFFLLWICSFFLWNIEIKGNKYLSNVLITDFLQRQGVQYGMPLKNILVEQLEKNIRKEFYDITWISVSINGTTLMLEIKENDTIRNQKPENFQNHLYAQEDGIVKEILVRQGTAMVKVGDAVKKGDLLISGEIEIPVEDGGIKKKLLSQAKGDIKVRYTVPIKEVLLLEYDTRIYTGEEKREYEFRYKENILGKNRKKFPYPKYDYYEEEITPGIIKKFLPEFKIYHILYREYYLQREKYTKQKGEKILNENFNKILKSLEEKGVQIIEKNVKISTNSVSMQLTGTLTAEQVIKEKDIRNE